ncbi:hypothetical protein CRM22_005015 [Opisthorchis felineus]|uniref:EF-hand domain-containing protein n=1 Tax=Opisthorchis felineus TaxID=147828 RepID=A0A4S2LT96_OPIFE|nr:hypothetical protein CRM22_005015 [Opisthorchis felineus]
MATEALQELLKDYDLEQNGFLDKAEWIKLCAQDGINLSPDLASALFDGLDTDADGQVQIGDIVKELSNWELAMEFPQTPLLSDRRSLSFDQPHQGNESPSAVPLNQAHRPRESRRKMKRNYQQKDHSRFLSQSSGAHSDNNGGLFTTKKELAEDGSEVFCTTPVPIHPRYKNLMELETEISRSYPKLLPSFNNVIEDFRTEIISSRQEQSTLEQNYLRDRRELLNRDEEKQQLYAQLESLRNIAFTRQDEHDFFAQRHGRLTPESTHSRSESLHSYDQRHSSMNTVVDAPTTPKPPERIFKIILIGDTGVGKSSFMHQFCDHVFYPRLSATVGVDFRTRNIRVDKYVYSIQLWDTAGQEKYRSIVRTYFRKVDGVIIVYDVTEPQSFRNVRSWMDQISEFGSEQKVPVIVVGNKIDLRKMETENCVTTETGKKFAETYGVMFLETSVCTSENVDEAVRLLASFSVDPDT